MNPLESHLESLIEPMVAVHAAIDGINTTTTSITIGRFSCTAVLRKHGKIVYINWKMSEDHTNSGVTPVNWNIIGNIPSDYRPSNVICVPIINGGDTPLACQMYVDGSIAIYPLSVNLGYELGMSLTWIQA